jgi:hypothetical protein
LGGDLVRGHEQRRGERVSLFLDLFDAPDLLAVQDEVSQFVGGVEA